MTNSLQILKNVDLLLFRKNQKLFSVWGIILIILGIMAISTSAFATLLSVYFLSALLLASGMVILVDSFTFWWGKWKGFFLHLIMSLLYIAVGTILLLDPLLGTLALTLLLGFFYIMLGAFRIGYSLYLHAPQWGWSLFNGIISFILGILILIQWPASSLYVIGLLVGIDLLLSGWAYIMVSLLQPRVSKYDNHYQ
jgi:uncharacterized membrane protein HdeD (DUF308 family)